MKLLKWPMSHDHAQEQAAIPFQALLDSLHETVLILDQSQHIQFINRDWQRLSGYALSESFERQFTDFIHPEDRVNWLNAFQQISNKPSDIVWLRLLTKDQAIRWCEIRFQPMSAHSSYPVSATLCDITPQVRDEQVRNADHRSLQSLVDRIPAMLYRARNNKSWTMEYVSQACELITGYPAEALLNQSQLTLGSMIHDDDSLPVWEQVQEALEANTVFDLTYRITRSDGSSVMVQDKGRGLYSESGMVLGVEGIILQV